MRVLVVEDEPKMRALLRRALAEEGSPSIPPPTARTRCSWRRPLTSTLWCWT